MPHTCPAGFTADLLFIILANIGTTITPWQIFFQQSAVVDKGLDVHDIKFGKIDTLVGALADVRAWRSSSSSPPARRSTTTTRRSSSRTRGRRPRRWCRCCPHGAGATGRRRLFAIGLFDAGFLGALCISLSTSWAVGEVFGWAHSLNKSVREAPWFYVLYLGMLLTAGAVVLIPGRAAGHDHDVRAGGGGHAAAGAARLPDPAAERQAARWASTSTRAGRTSPTGRSSSFVIVMSTLLGIQTLFPRAVPVAEERHGTRIPKPSRSRRTSTRPTGTCTSCYFSELLKRPVCAGTISNRIGKLTDLVFRQAEPYPGGGRHLPRTRLGQADRVHPVGQGREDRGRRDLRAAARRRTRYPPFVDQPGWILVDKHLMGRTILDMDGRRIEVVNDVHLLEIARPAAPRARGHLVQRLPAPVGARARVTWVKDHLISWKYVQPLSLEDAVPTDRVTLSVTAQPDPGPARRGPGRRARRAVRQGAAGPVLGPRLGEGGRDADRGRAARAAADHRGPDAGPGARRLRRR